MTRTQSIFWSLLFTIVVPGSVAGLVPWLITRWHRAADPFASPDAWPVGIILIALGLPVLLLAPVGGMVVDRFPRRTVLICTQGSQMILAFILAWLSFAGIVQVWQIVVLAFLLGVTNAFDVPARQLRTELLAGNGKSVMGFVIAVENAQGLGSFNIDTGQVGLHKTTIRL